MLSAAIIQRREFTRRFPHIDIRNVTAALGKCIRHRGRVRLFLAGVNSTRGPDGVWNAEYLFYRITGVPSVGGVPIYETVDLSALPH